MNDMKLIFFQLGGVALPFVWFWF